MNIIGPEEEKNENNSADYACHVNDNIWRARFCGKSANIVPDSYIKRKKHCCSQG